MIVIELAGLPKGKGRPRFNVKTGRAYTPAPTQKAEANLAYAATKAMEGLTPLDGPLHMTVHASMPTAASWSKRKQADARAGLLRPTGKPDFDNIAKMVDGLNKIVWGDDSQIVEATIRKTYSDKPGLRLEVRQILTFLE